MAAPAATGPPLRKPVPAHKHSRAVVQRSRPPLLQPLLLLLQLQTLLLLLTRTTGSDPLPGLGGDAGGSWGLTRVVRRAVAAMRPMGNAGGGVAEGGADCAPGCELRGNCDRETGRCLCPWGYTGEVLLGGAGSVKRWSQVSAPGCDGWMQTRTVGFTSMRGVRPPRAAPTVGAAFSCVPIVSAPRRLFPATAVARSVQSMPASAWHVGSWLTLEQGALQGPCAVKTMQQHAR